MKIICHRGLWDRKSEQNTLSSFVRALDHGFGVETDLRDCNGQLVISHNPPNLEAPRFSDFARLTRHMSPTAWLALNIKADGLQSLITQEIETNRIGGQHFFFDMSIPDLLQYQRAHLTTFTRISEIEPQPVLLEQAQGIWLDCFQRDWFDEDLLLSFRQLGKLVCVVSPELHGRSPDILWQSLKKIDDLFEGTLMLCTDLPLQAARLFSQTGAPPKP